MRDFPFDIHLYTTNRPPAGVCSWLPLQGKNAQAVCFLSSLTAQIAALCSELMELRVPRLGSNEDGNVRVGVFPQREEVLIRRELLDLASRGPKSIANCR